MSDSQDRLKPPFVHTAVPSERVQGFLEEHPTVNWRESLHFLLDHYQQIVGGRIQYLIEGGVAVKLLHSQRQEPNDVDIVTRSEEMVEEFKGSKRFDVKSLNLWYSIRLWPYNVNAFASEPGRFLLDLHQPTEFQGREVLILNSLVLTASKTLRYLNRDPRDKDIEDVRLLNQDPQEVQALITRIRTSYSQLEF